MSFFRPVAIRAAQSFPIHWHGYLWIDCPWSCGGRRQGRGNNSALPVAGSRSNRSRGQKASLAEGRKMASKRAACVHPYAARRGQLSRSQRIRWRRGRESPRFAQHGLRNAGQLVRIDPSLGMAEFMANSASLLTIRPCSVVTEPPQSAPGREKWQTLGESLPLESAGKPEQTEYQARFACGSFPERSACDCYGHKASHSSTVASSASVKVKLYLSLTSSCCVA